MEKLSQLRSQFNQSNIDGLLITSEFNRRYLTNFTGTSGVALISKNAAVFITDFRYVEQAGEQAKGFKIVRHAGPIVEEVAKQVKLLGIDHLGFEQDHLTYAQFKMYEKYVSSQL